ncbi:AI-2E family transporter [Altererythrobacter arenosus]|uniref:AI-2E family transporter n=1 Tax=Altererythrobacter arenosus TaxID=3032592 RepID=A0ABY8FTS1_9SPHN|nr:AI-2E family transporter [Altererythrobacter sp. CAU 1644]WFL78417.1 AI-2E family transporter [Altererythrobacter sp. CAU 1644]
MEGRRETRHIEQGGFLLLLALVTLALAWIVWPFAAPLLWATLAAIMFQPLYQRILRRMPTHPSRAAALALLVIFVAVLVPAFWIGSMVVNEAASLVIAFQRGEIDVAAWFEQVLAALPANIRQSLDTSGWTDLAILQTRAQEFLAESAGLIAQQAVAVGGGVFSFVLAFGVGLYVTYFLLRDGTQVGEKVTAALPLERPVADRLVEKFLGIVRATIKGSVVVGLVQGALGAITFWIVGMPSIVLFGVLMAVFSLLPALGPALVWAPVAIYLLATGAIWQGIVVVVSGVAVIGMADNLLRPILVGRDTGIPDWIILVSTLGGIAMAGLSGIVLGPMAAGLFIACWSILSEQRGVSRPVEVEQ